MIILPCISIYKTEPSTGYCYGCARTIEEKKTWKQAETTEERKIDNIKTIKKLPKIKNVKEILYPGQSKFSRFKINYKKEINISKTVLKDLEYLQGF